MLLLPQPASVTTRVWCVSVCKQHFNELWKNQSSVDLPQLLTECPPAMASNMAELLYGRFLSTVPLFRFLSKEVISALCKICRPLVAMKSQVQ